MPPTLTASYPPLIPVSFSYSGAKVLHEEVVERLDERTLADGGQRLGGGAGQPGSEGAANGDGGDAEELAAARHGILHVGDVHC
jgi:hypothetical protein